MEAANSVVSVNVFSIADIVDWRVVATLCRQLIMETPNVAIITINIIFVCILFITHPPNIVKYTFDSIILHILEQKCKGIGKRQVVRKNKYYYTFDSRNKLSGNYRRTAQNEI